MRGLIVAGLLLMGGGVASANPIESVGEATNTLGHSVVRLVQLTGESGKWVIVKADWVAEVVYDAAHNKFLHPLVSALTLGGVQL